MNTQEQIDSIKKDINDLKVFSIQQNIHPEVAKILSEVIKKLNNLEVNNLKVNTTVSFFGSTPQGQQPAIAKPTITGVASADIASLKVAVDKLIDTVKNIGITL